MKAKKMVMVFATAFAALCSCAREITGISFTSDMSMATVAFTTGETGDGHVMYLAYGASDLGDTLYAWANGGGDVSHGNVSDDATSASVALPAEARTAACYRAFLVKKILTPAYTTKLIDCIREDNGNAWFATDYFCDGNEAITAVFEGMRASNKRPFGSRSPDKTSIFEAFHGTGTGWGYLYLDPENPSKWEIENWAMSDNSYDGRTELTLDVKNRRYQMKGEDGTSSSCTIATSRVFLVGVDKSPYPLCIFATGDSADGSSVVGHYAGPNALLYRFYVKTNDAAYARYYIPSISTVNAGKGCLWDAVENKIVESSRPDDYLRSFFLTEDASEKEYPELDFHAAVPAELQTKYERVVSSFAVGRQITAFSVEKDAGTGLITATVSLTSGAADETCILYVAWGESDMGDTLAAWGGNVHCAGEVAANSTLATVTLPAGKYPLVFRAFLMKVEALECDSFAEYLLSDGASYIATDWYATRGDKIAMTFALGSTAGNQRIFGAWDGKADSTAVELYTTSYSSGALCYGALLNANGTAKWPSQIFTYDISGQTVSYDTDSRELSFTQGAGTTVTKTMVNSSSGTDTSKDRSEHALDIFWSNRGSRIDAHHVLADAKFYSMTIMTNGADGAATARHYIPAVKNGVYGVWDAVDNNFLTPPNAFLAPTNGTGEVCAAVPFLDAVPETLQSKYLSQSSTLSAVRKTEGLSIIIR